MISIIFDLDDTLYFQKEQFVQATAVSSPELDAGTVDRLYQHFQRTSERAYVKREKGEISFDEMHVLRIKEAYEAVGEDVTVQGCQTWQKNYQREQQQISLPETVIEILDYCQRQSLELGIITNGPVDHQRMKIKALGLERWFPEEQILVSGDIGISKPDQRIFTEMGNRLKGDENQRYYVGDNFLNDIEGALTAGWQPIWLSEKGDLPDSASGIRRANSHESLLETIKEITAWNKSQK